MFIQKIRNAIMYAQALQVSLQSEENRLHEAIWRQTGIVAYARDLTVFEEVGVELQTIEELHTREVDSHMHNIVHALNHYRVAFGDAETKQRPLGEVMLEVIAHWNGSVPMYTPPSFAGPPSVLGVMLVQYLQRLRLQGSSFVPATLVVKPATVVVLLMLAIKYNDDHSPDNPKFYHMLGSYTAMMSLSLEHNGMTFTAPRFADLEDGEYTRRYPKGYCIFTKCLSKHDKQAFEAEKQNSGKDSAIMLYTGWINRVPMKNIHNKVALWALQTLEVEVLAALDWKLDAISPIDSPSDDQFWARKDHAKHDNFWFWECLAQINAAASAKRPNLDPVSPDSDVPHKHSKTA
jgi:hypothetical protein